MGYKYDQRKSKMKGWGMGNFMLYKSMATYPAKSRRLKSQLLIETKKQKLQHWKEFLWKFRPLFSNWSRSEN